MSVLVFVYDVDERVHRSRKKVYSRFRTPSKKKSRCAVVGDTLFHIARALASSFPRDPVVREAFKQQKRRIRGKSFSTAGRLFVEWTKQAHSAICLENPKHTAVASYGGTWYSSL